MGGAKSLQHSAPPRLFHSSVFGQINTGTHQGLAKVIVVSQVWRDDLSTHLPDSAAALPPLTLREIPASFSEAIRARGRDDNNSGFIQIRRQQATALC